MAINRRIAALLLTTGLAVSAAALIATSAHADALPWYGCKSADVVGAATVVDAVAVGGGGCQAFAGASETGPSLTESMIVAPDRDVAGMFVVYDCKAGVGGILGDHAVKGVACSKLDMTAEALRKIVGDTDFDKAFSS